MASSAAAARRKRAVESFSNAAETIGPLERGMALFAMTRGQWSMIDAILYVCDALGPGAQVSVWTWTIADYEVQAFQGLMWRKDLAGASLVVDMSADKRNRPLLNQWRAQFGDDAVRVCRSHAKIARVWAGEWRFLLRGSMNLNHNPRFEQFDLTEGGDDFDLVRQIEEEMPILRSDYTFADVAAATKLNRAFDEATLQQFGALESLVNFRVKRI